MIKSSCHCGAVRLEIDGELPKELTSCNCSICKRYGNLMTYYPPAKVRVIAAPAALADYVWGDKMIAFQRCVHCGCMSYWVSLTPKQTEFMGVNVRLFEDFDPTTVRVRRLDGADTWKYLD